MSDQKNELATIQKSEWLVLQPDSEIADAIQEKLAHPDDSETIQEQDLSKVTIPTGGSTTWTWTDIEGEHSSREIEGLIVHVQKRGILWPHSEMSGEQPLLKTNDLVVAYKQGKEYGDIDPDTLEKYRLPEGGYDWRNLPWNQWGTGNKGIGKRCKEMRLVFVLRREDAWPLMLQISPGSLKPITSFLVKLSMRSPIYRSVVNFSLKKVDSEQRSLAYSQVVPQLVGTISKAEGDLVKRIYTDPIRRLAERVEVVRTVETEEEVF